MTLRRGTIIGAGTIIALIVIIILSFISMSGKLRKVESRQSALIGTKDVLHKSYMEHIVWFDSMTEFVYEDWPLDEEMDNLKLSFEKFIEDFKPEGENEENLITSVRRWHNVLLDSAEDIAITDDLEAKQEIYQDNFKSAANSIKPLVGGILDIYQKKIAAGYDEMDSLKKGTGYFIIAASMVIAFAVILVVIAFFRWGLKPLDNAVNISNQLAKGDLTIDVEVNNNRKDEISQLLFAMKNMVEKLREIVGEVRSTSDNVASGSQELSASSEQMSRGITEQAGKASQIATSTSEMSQTVIDIAKNAANISSSAADTLKIAQDGAGIVSNTVNEVKEIAGTVAESSQLMTSLGTRSKQIGDIVGVINDIAGQTNLLALNAAIEAARAGEQGRGFAVVADEVRKLAENTAKATKEISQMIRAIQGETERAVSAMEESSKKVEKGVDFSTQAGDALHRILDSVKGLQSMVQQIASATEEMSTASEQISGDIEAIASISEETSTGSEQVSRSSSDLARLSTNLQGVVRQFKLNSNGYGMAVEDEAGGRQRQNAPLKMVETTS